MNPEVTPDPLAIQQPCRRFGLDEAIHPAQIAAYRRMTAGQKLDAMSQMYQIARQMLRNQVRRQHPDWDEASTEREVSRRFAHGAS